MYQDNLLLDAEWKVENEYLSFNIKEYDKSKELVIDPVTRVWATYYGGSGYDQVRSTAVDDSSNVYIAGNTNSPVVIATSGSHQTTLGGVNDAFIAKFNTYGVRLWATYYGGTGDDYAYSCSAEQDNVFFAGTTNSTNTVISTNDAHQLNNGGGNDAFVVKLTASGIRVWATFYGGNLYDQGNCCIADKNGNVYLSGLTTTTVSNVIATAGGHQSIHNGGNEGFLVKFDGVGVRQWGTYYGGSLYDSGNACSVDSAGNVFLSGHTQSTSNISTSGSYQTSLVGSRDAYLAKFNPAGVRQWGTYFGGPADDWGFGLTVDKSGNPYITGNTFSGSGVATPGSYQSSPAGLYDSFLSKFNSNGALLWATYYGGANMEASTTVCADMQNNIYMTGQTQSTLGIATPGSPQTLYGGGQDAFLAKFSSSGAMQWSTYYGGPAYETGEFMAADKAGAIYLAGFSDSNTNTVIATPGSHQPNYSGTSYDGFLAKFTDCMYSPLNISSTSSLICTGNPATLTAGGSATYTWNTSSTSSSIVITPTISTTFTVSGTDVNNCINYVSFTQSVSVCTGMDEINASANQLGLYPNPATNWLRISGEDKKNCFVILYSVCGQKLLEKILAPGDCLDIGQLATGIYFIRASTDNAGNTLKFVKE